MAPDPNTDGKTNGVARDEKGDRGGDNQGNGDVGNQGTGDHGGSRRSVSEANGRQNVVNEPAAIGTMKPDDIPGQDKPGR